MNRFALLAALALGAVALVGPSASANVATGGITKLNTQSFQSSIEEVGRHRVCRRKCSYFGPIKTCKRKCWWH
jgi:hypothetical protein